MTGAKQTQHTRLYMRAKHKQCNGQWKLRAEVSPLVQALPLHGGGGEAHTEDINDSPKGSIPITCR